MELATIFKLPPATCKGEPFSTHNGMALIMVSGVYIGYREVVNARTSIKPTAEASFAPGNPGGVHDDAPSER